LLVIEPLKCEGTKKMKERRTTGFPAFSDFTAFQRFSVGARRRTESMVVRMGLACRSTAGIILAMGSSLLCRAPTSVQGREATARDMPVIVSL
jgi:hypothetical protein